MSENILEIKNLSKYFGGLAAVSDCSLKVSRGTITGIIGPNGSGKTTLFNSIVGTYPIDNGSIKFNDRGFRTTGTSYCKTWIVKNFSTNSNLWKAKLCRKYAH